VSFIEKTVVDAQEGNLQSLSSLGAPRKVAAAILKAANHGPIPYSLPTDPVPAAMRHIIAILLQNEAGALTRVAGLFSTRGYNIESLSVAPTDDATVSRITLVTKGSEAVIQQILSHLNKVVDVVSVEDMTLGEHLERELVLLKLKVRAGQSDAVRGYVVRTGGRVLDPAPDGFVVELTASEAEVTAFVAELARQAQLLEVARSGALGMGRSARTLRVVR
jgi:acetolactate synthase-1/3 small subunit